MKITKKRPILNALSRTIIDLPAPSNISNIWNFGSLLGICLGIQLVRGIFLAIHYSSDIRLAFNCISHIIRDVEAGWLVRIIHANGASLFFIGIYLHLGRNLYYNSFLLSRTWLVGVIIFLISIITAFLGYVLPWGQISFWGATVITNLLSAIPYLGQIIVEWIWGGFSVNNATLSRFFSLHYLIPFLICILVIIHLIFLHEEKSSNPMGIQASRDKIPFQPYFTVKDLVRIIIFIFLFILLNIQIPFLLIDPENFLPANPIRTPVHIQPEWYFLFAYAILRSIPNKLGGVIALLISILILVPLVFSQINTQLNKIKITHLSFWSFLIVFLFLTWLGIKPVEYPYIELGSAITYLYFIWFISIIVSQ
jgi:ubiquinol-cytochrome c reductase cytochrome b subunit